MREIKFIAWDKKKKYMFDVMSIDWEDIGKIAFAYDNSRHFLTDIELQQYTGLKDKNGVEIYEGDIMKVLDRDWPSQLDSYPEMNHQQYLDSISSICKVTWNKETARFQLKQIRGKGYFSESLRLWSGRDVFEIIGNVFENKELLNDS